MYPYYCRILTKFVFFFKKSSNIKRDKKSVQCEPSCSMQTDGRTDGWTDMKLIVAFRKSANSPTTMEIATNAESQFNIHLVVQQIMMYEYVLRFTFAVCHFSQTLLHHTHKRQV